MPKFVIVRPTVKSKKTSMEDQKECWSGIDMLLYIANYFRLDIGKATRELSTLNNDTNPVAFNELLHVIKYALDT